MKIRIGHGENGWWATVFRRASGGVRAGTGVRCVSFWSALGFAARQATERHHYMAPCHEQPGKQEWHLYCAVRHPLRFLRSRGPLRWRYSGPALPAKSKEME